MTFSIKMTVCLFYKDSILGLWLKNLKQKKNESVAVATDLSKKETKWQEREKELIHTAHELVDLHGFANLTMDKLVDASVFSKGTIYKHFSSKEDLLVALGIHSISLNLELMNKALNYDGCSREKALALHFAYQLFGRLEPALFSCVLSTKSPAVVEKASAERLALFFQKEQEIAQICDTIFRQGIADKSLALANSLSIEQLSFASWSFSFGTNLLLNNAGECHGVSRISNHNVLLTNINLLFDGMNWQPLSTNFDYQTTWRNLESYFSEYIELVSKG